MTEADPAVPPRAVPDPGTVGVAVLDANCLFSKHGRYLLLAFAVRGVVRARWSRRLLEETALSLAKKGRGDSLEDFDRWQETEVELVRDGLVENYERWLPQAGLPDPDDDHVLATAIECGATTIVTSNFGDFPEGILARFGIRAMSPDEFALACINANPVIAATIVTTHPDPEKFLDRLGASLPDAARYLRDLIR